MKIWRRSAVIAAVRLDGTIASGARAAAVSRRTVERLIAADPRFAAEIEAARAAHDAAEAAYFEAIASRLASRAS